LWKPQFFRERPQTRERIGIMMGEFPATPYNDLKIYVYPLQRGAKDELHVVDFHHYDFIDILAANLKRAGGNR